MSRERRYRSLDVLSGSGLIPLVHTRTVSNGLRWCLPGEVGYPSPEQVVDSSAAPTGHGSELFVLFWWTKATTLRVPANAKRGAHRAVEPATFDLVGGTHAIHRVSVHRDQRVVVISLLHRETAGLRNPATAGCVRLVKRHDYSSTVLGIARLAFQRSPHQKQELG